MRSAIGRSFVVSALVALSFLIGCKSKKQHVPAVAPEPVRIRLVAVGDVMMHQDVQRSAQGAGSFDALWGDVSPLLVGADIAFGNLETPVAPDTGVHGRPFVFNAPRELPDALKRSGFQVLATANNHGYDQGPKGVTETLAHLEASGLVSVGSGPDQAQAEAPKILVRRGIRIAFLGCTDIFNNNLNREGKGPWIAELGDRTIAAVRAARLQADVVIVSVHWGAEYQHQPSARQREMAQKLFESGADLILGHHPHVLQPLERSSCNGRSVAVAFSMGNFISNQDRMYQAVQPVKEGDSRDGMALTATFTLQVSPDGSRRAVMEKVGYVPLWTVNNWSDVQTGRARVRSIRVLPTERLQVEDPLRNLRMDRVQSIVGHLREPLG